MKNLFISIILFFLLNVCILISINYLNKTCKNLITINSQIQSSIKENSWAKAEALTEGFSKEWISHTKMLSVFVDHKEMDEINIEFYKLMKYVSNESTDEASASSNVISFFLNHIMEMEKINPQNIF